MLGTIVDLSERKQDMEGNHVSKANIRQILDFMVYGKVLSQFMGGQNPPKELKTAMKNLTDVIWRHINAGNINENFISTTFGNKYTSFFKNEKYDYLQQKKFY
ncbi:MAG: hypothetical protein LBG59_08210 [Candidatus Peribacteria bacterium]|nr:hypothetical protein [Candidatus Peribacteria bacterium]